MQIWMRFEDLNAICRFECDMRIWMQYADLNAIFWFKCDMRPWMRYADLNAICRFECDMRIWMRYADLNAIWGFDCNMQIWMQYAYLKFWNAMHRHQLCLCKYIIGRRPRLMITKLLQYINIFLETFLALFHRKKDAYVFAVSVRELIFS